ncbi:MAG: ABC transporter permease [Candidatus Latescibacteria bacterium]|nr:ABC transporter permease [Candidatus Latescibacterota bacterium]
MSQSTLLLPVLTLWWREIVRFYRQKNRVIGALGSPLVFWFLIGSGLGTSFQHPVFPEGRGYLTYFFPGTMLLILLFTSIFSTISIIEDRREGFLQSVLVAPVPRSGLVLGKILGGTTLALMQGLIFLALAPTVGIVISVQSLVMLVGTLSLISFGLTGLGFCIAWRLDSTQGFHAIMNVFLIPMWLLSGSIFPTDSAPTWLWWIMHLNPMMYGLSALRLCLYPGNHDSVGGFPSLTFSLGITAFFGLVTFGVSSVLAARRTTVV